MPRDEDFLRQLEYKTGIQEPEDRMLGLVEAVVEDTKVGSAGFSFFKPTKALVIGNAEYMFRTDPSYQRRGLAEELGNRVLDLARSSVPEKPNSIVLVTKKDNYGMMNVASKIGFSCDPDHPANRTSGENVTYTMKNL